MIKPALGHAISSKVEHACRRSNLLAKRRELMAQWADALAKPVKPALTVVSSNS